ncbi:MAG: oxidoreductase, partial [Hungatella sp.]
ALLPRLGTLRHVAFQYCQYSSRYDKFKEGMVMNAFNPLLSNAALMDIGVYCVHPMVKLFGMPQKISADSIFLSNGMEGMGTVIADYGAMQAVLVYSKIVNSYLPSQIEGEAGSMLIREISEPKEIELYLRNGDHEVIKIDKKGNNMYYEIMELLRLIENGEDGSIHNQYSLYEMEVMDEVRKCAGIDFSVKTL